jgi:cysteine-rich repeat protein
MSVCHGFRALVASTAVAALAGGADAATITIVNVDTAAEGLNDSTPVSPVGGNSGTTLGAQRLIALQYAAGLWGGLLTSGVEIKVDASFDPLSCSASSGVLGLAGPQDLWRDFTGAPAASTWYPQALANKLYGSDLGSTTNDIEAMFNVDVGTFSCLSSKTWYYGLDAAATSSEIDFVTVALHELGHGLGFLTAVDLATGAKAGGFDDAYMLNLEDHSTTELYPDMTDAERVTASTDTGDLHWVGATVGTSSGYLTSGRHASGHVEMYAPNPQEPGSSVSHFSDSLSPDNVLEPSYVGPNHDVSLAAALMTDLGWGAICGNGVAEGSEACDDGNTLAGDCCSATCTAESAGSPCPGDGNVCTDDACDGAGACVGTPNSEPCDDGDACTIGDQCSGGACVGGPSITSCTDGDGCCPAGCNDTNDVDCIIVPTASPLGWGLLAALLALALGRHRPARNGRRGGARAAR